MIFAATHQPFNNFYHMTNTQSFFYREELDFIYTMRWRDYQQSYGRVEEQLPYDTLQIIARKQQNICEEFKNISDLATQEGDPVKVEDTYRWWVLFVSTKFDSAVRRVYHVINTAAIISYRIKTCNYCH